LDEAVCLLDRDLCEFAVPVKSVEDVALRHLFGGEIAYKKA
jgi:hypothetical protein